MISQKVTNIIGFILGFILAFVLLDKYSIYGEPETITVHDTIATTDTINIKGKHTTTYIDRPHPVYVYLAPDSLKDSSLCDTIRYYSHNFEDSLVNVTIYDTIVGIAVGTSMDITVKDRFVITHDTLFVDSLIIKPSSSVYASGGIGGNNSLFVGVDYTSAEKWGLGYSYNLGQKTHNLFFRWKIVLRPFGLRVK